MKLRNTDVGDACLHAHSYSNTRLYTHLRSIKQVGYVEVAYIVACDDIWVACAHELPPAQQQLLLGIEGDHLLRKVDDAVKKMLKREKLM